MSLNISAIAEEINKLAYAFWPKAQEASQFIVVGECPIDPDGEEYLRRLKVRFSLPIEYEQIVI
jgi:hypothetical protein